MLRCTRLLSSKEAENGVFLFGLRVCARAARLSKGSLLPLQVPQVGLCFTGSTFTAAYPRPLPVQKVSYFCVAVCSECQSSVRLGGRGGNSGGCLAVAEPCLLLRVSIFTVWNCSLYALC